MISHLPRVVPAPPDRPAGAGPDHPMRQVTRQAAFDPNGWDPPRASKVTALFDGLAAEWHTRASEPRLAPVSDALERGGPLPTRRWVEVGSGSGLLTPYLASRCQLLVPLDISQAMLDAAPATGSRVRADAAHLPLADGSVDALLLINALLFPSECSRVLAAEGVLVWVNTSGDRTPIHLPAEDVAQALGAGWHGVASEAAWGTWAVLRR